MAAYSDNEVSSKTKRLDTEEELDHAEAIIGEVKPRNFKSISIKGQRVIQTFGETFTNQGRKWVTISARFFIEQAMKGLIIPRDVEDRFNNIIENSNDPDKDCQKVRDLIVEHNLDIVEVEGRFSPKFQWIKPKQGKIAGPLRSNVMLHEIGREILTRDMAKYDFQSLKKRPQNKTIVEESDFYIIDSDDEQENNVTHVDPDVKLRHELKPVASGNDLDIANYISSELKVAIHQTSHAKGRVWGCLDENVWEEMDMDAVAILIIGKNAANTIRNRSKMFIRRDDKTEKFKDKIFNITSNMMNLKKATSVAKYLVKINVDNKFEKRLDANPDIFAIAGGKVVDLRTGKVRDRVTSDYVTRVSKVRYNPNAKSKALDKFLKDITLGDNEIRDLLQYILGGCLTGKNEFRKIFILIGNGSNGKSTLMLLMSKILGDFYTEAGREVFIKGGMISPGAPNPFVADLDRRRMAVYSEVADDDKINDTIIKRFTGNDHILARHLYGHPFSFLPQFKPFILANHEPIAPPGTALWDRMIMIPFNARFVNKKIEECEANEKPRDPKLMDRITKNEKVLSALLNWLIEGAKRTYVEEMIIPDTVRLRTEDYKKSQDIFTDYVQSGRIEWDASEDTKAADLYRDFIKWYNSSEQSGKRPSQKTFGIQMANHIDKKRLATGVIYCGVKLHYPIDSDD